MKNTLNINSENFQLSLHIERFDIEAQGLLHVNVTSDTVSAKADMDISINDYEKFLENMQQMHQNLRGEAIIAEPYGDKQFLKFTMDDHTGHVYVKGELASRYNGHIQYLSIENEFDQSSLSCIRDNYAHMKRNTYTCPVCGYDKLEEPPYDEFGCPTYVICPCCGFEFGFDDMSEGSSFSEYQQRWIDKGFPFFNSKKKPSNWNERVMRRQLEYVERGGLYQPRMNKSDD